jgi:hypothetical protein
LFAHLTEQAEKVFASPAVAASLTVPLDAALWRLPVIGSAVVPDAMRQAKQAELNFVTAWLRKTSGAAISQGEYTNAENTFFPRPWDDPGTLQQKAQARRDRHRGAQGGRRPGLQAPPDGGGDTGRHAAAGTGRSPPVRPPDP